MNQGKPMILNYRTGEEIKKGDRVRYHQNPAIIELVATEPCNPETDWYVQEYGGGVMILDPVVSGRTFIDVNEIDEYEDLEFVSRAEEP
jgi:hypothetical protein